jgi:hypothetical protein
MESVGAIVSTDPEIRRLDEKIALLTAAMYAKKPWYRDISTLISVSAFLISVLSTTFSLIHGYLQDIDTKRNELHAAFREFNATNLQVEEAKLKYPGQAGDILRIAFAQNALLAKKTYSLARSLGSSATGTDLVGAAIALRYMGQDGLAQILLEAAKTRINDVAEYINVYKLLGGVKIAGGDLQGGNADFGMATKAFSVYRTPNTDFIVTTDFATELDWAKALSSVDCEAAALHLRHAGDLLPQSHNPNVGQMAIDLNLLQASIANCKPVPGPSAANK